MQKRFLTKVITYSLILSAIVFIIFANYFSNTLKYLKTYQRLTFNLFQFKAHEPTILCLILTTKNNLLNKRTQTVYDTWAHKCDDHKFILLIPGKQVNTRVEEKMNNFTLLQPERLLVDSYGKLSDKVFNMFIDAYNHNINQFDWFLKADDDTFVFVDNLRTFLSTKNSTYPFTYGYDFNIIVSGGYHSGGAGYILSNEALNRLGTKLSTNYTSCRNSGLEDVDVGACLRTVGVTMEKSLDSFGRERFLPQIF